MCSMSYQCMVGNVQRSMCSMKCTDEGTSAGAGTVCNVQSAVCHVQCAVKI